MAALVVLSACSSGDYHSSPAPATTTPATATSSTTTTVAEVTVRGVVSGVFASARVLQLSPAVEGVASVALNADTEIVGASGAKASLADILPGRTTVEATGRRTTTDTLLARRVVLR